jgi:electron transport complex protein RnfB
MSWALPGAILFLLGLILLLGYFLSKKVFPNEASGTQGADPLGRSPCDGCDVAGCGGFAKALVRGGSEDPEDTAKNAKELSCGDPGAAASRPREMKALIRCSGSRISLRYRYSGAPSCRAAAGMAVRPKDCGNACLGFGDCVPSCPPRAIQVVNGIARVDRSRCDGCGECLGSCPVGLVALIPAERGFVVLCKEPQGPSEDWTCPDGCTLCGRCVEACPESALENTEGGMPQWIEDRCNGCGECVEACLQNVVLLSWPPLQAKASNASREPTSAPLPGS